MRQPLRGCEMPPAPARVRALTAADADAFAAFHAAASDEDRDEAFVELEHWAVVGAIVDGRLAAVASAYPWHGSPLADIGVLTLEPFRGRGLARDVVRTMSRTLLERGYEPLYRCDFDNRASAAVARSAGMERLGTWDALANDEG